MSAARARVDTSHAVARRSDERIARRPRPEPDGAVEQARVLDFIEYRARRMQAEQQTVAQAHAELLLGEILWNVGEEKARPLVEALLALLAGLEERVTEREIAALRLWLARHPL